MIEPLVATWRRFGRALSDMKSEAGLRARMKNIGHLLAGNFGAAAISMGTVAFAARSLGVERYGELALIVTYVQTIERFCSFQSWQPVIRYGAELKAQEKLSDLKSLLKFAVFLDIGAAVLGWLIACGLAILGAHVFDWPDRTAFATALYSTALLFTVTGAPTGMLRLAGKFREIAYLQVASMTVRLALCFVAMIAGWGLMAFVAIWTITHILALLLLIAAGYRVLGDLGVRDFFKEPIGDIRARFPNILRFSLLTNFSLTVRSSSHQMDTLLVGALTGAGGAGIYHIAKRISKFALQAGQQVQAVVFPDVARLWARGEFTTFRHVVMQTETILFALSAVGVVLTFIVAEPLIRLIAGSAFLPAATLLKVQIIAVAFLLCGSVTRTGLLCMGRETTVFALSVVATAAFFATSAILLPRVGAVGANFGHVIAGGFLVVGLWIAFRLAFARRVANPQSAPKPVASDDPSDAGDPGDFG